MSGSERDSIQNVVTATEQATPKLSAPPVRIQRKRTKGWKMPENTVSVTRPGRFGNPFDLSRSEHCWTAIAMGFKADPAGRRLASIKLFRDWINKGSAVRIQDCGLYVEKNGEKLPVASSPAMEAKRPPSLADIRNELRGKNLACFCALDHPCHADVLLELANSPAVAETRRTESAG